MSFKVLLSDSLSAIEWSQAAWRGEGTKVGDEVCQVEMIHGVLLRHLPKDGLIVDAGCGTAKWPIYLRRLGYRCMGVEISPEASRMARELDATLPIVGADTRRMSLKTGSADAVISLGVVEHDEAGPMANLLELRRILKPGHLLVIAVPFNNPFRRLLVNHLHRYVTWRRRQAKMGLGFAEYRFSKREVDRFLRDAGFEPIATYPNDLLPPNVMGLWIDFENLILNPYARSDPKPLFIMPGLRGRIARALVRFFPWFVAGEVVFVARAR